MNLACKWDIVESNSIRMTYFMPNKVDCFKNNSSVVENGCILGITFANLYKQRCLTLCPWAMLVAAESGDQIELNNL